MVDTMSSKDNETRTRILEATVFMLEKHRGQGVRMGDIAKKTGISRQAIYLHFPSRTELLVAATRYLDEQLDLESRLAPSRSAKSGIERLDLYIEFWGNYMPEIYGVAKAILQMQDTDKAAATAWKDRMLALRDGCHAAIEALHSDGNLTQEWTTKRATDAFWTMLSIRNWEHLTVECGWSTKQYIQYMKIIVNRSFVVQ